MPAGACLGSEASIVVPGQQFFQPINVLQQLEFDTIGHGCSTEQIFEILQLFSRFSDLLKSCPGAYRTILSLPNISPPALPGGPA